MQSFDIYPKKGDKFALEFHHFELRASEFVLYNDLHKESRAGYVSLENIAAVIPANLPEIRSRLHYDAEPITFCVYLKGRKPEDPIQITAFVCDASQPPSVKFFWKLFNVNKFEDQLLPNIYVATSEVVAIMPLGGLDVKS